MFGIAICSLLQTGHASPGTLAGTTRATDGSALASVLVTARPLGRGPAVTVLSDARGRYRFPGLPSGSYRLEAQRVGLAPVVRDSVLLGANATIDVELSAVEDSWSGATAAMLLGTLPPGETKRRFILDCTGCHQFDAQTVTSTQGGLKQRDEWLQRINQMLSFSGASTSFPIMSPSRSADETADWLLRNLNPAAARPPLEPPPPPSAAAARAVITEWDLPAPQDLPHDLMVAGNGEVVITGMSTHRMYVLDPQTGVFTERDIPVRFANPRALDIGPEGTWWVLLGFPQQVASFEPATGLWKAWDLGMYPHSVDLDASGRVWFNGHFTKNPELIGYLDPNSGDVTTFEVPVGPMPDGGSTIPYGLRVAPDGTVWGTELAGNRLIRFDPATERFRLYQLPTPFSGPRRLDPDAHGNVWIPEYAGNKLARFDVAAERFVEYEFPVPDALPYVVRVDRRRDVVWIGTAAADAVARFEPATERFTIYPLPTRGALIRHIDIDSATGAVWGAYSPAPAKSPKIFRLQVR